MKIRFANVRFRVPGNVPYVSLLIKREIRSSEMLHNVTFWDNLSVPSSRPGLTPENGTVRLC